LSCCCKPREAAGRETNPSAGIIDSQSVKTTESGGPRGYDPAKNVKDGPNLRDALAKFGDWTVEIVKGTAEAAGFQLLPRRWVLERTLAWLNRNRRLAKDFEASTASAKAWVYIASGQLHIRRLVCS
jgi:hypothetical protein